MGPASKDTCSYETCGGGKRHRREGHMEPEAETRVTQPRPRSPCSHQEQVGNGFFPSVSGGSMALKHLGFRPPVSKAMRITFGGFEPHILG